MDPPQQQHDERQSACADAAARYVEGRLQDETTQQRREFNTQLMLLVKSGRLTK